MIEDLGAIPVRTGQWRAPGIRLDRRFEPTTVEDLSQILTAASRERIGVLVMGGSTRLDWANPGVGISLGVSMLGLSGVDVFEPDEGVLHARAGTPISEIQSLVREAGWEFPLDAPGSTSTVGGVVASAATGPRAHAFGRVADTILGLEVVGAEGVASKCGGRVVKNVTGYDLAKLYCGSFGALGVLTGAWLRLRPVSEKCVVRSASLPRDPAGFESCRALSRLTSVRALVWIEGESGDADEGLYIELGGSDAEVDHDLDTIESALATSALGVERMDALRDARASARGDSVIFRARVLGADCEAFVRRVREAGLAVSVDLGLGVVHARGNLESPEALLSLREVAGMRGGLLTIERIPDAWRDRVDVFGVTEGSQDLASSIKSRFDPAGILNPGRFVAVSRGEDERRI